MVQNMAHSSNDTTPTLGTEPLESSSPNKSHLPTPPFYSSPEIDGLVFETSQHVQDATESSRAPVRRSTRDRKPTSRFNDINKQSQTVPSTPSPKRIKVSTEKWVPSDSTTRETPDCSKPPKGPCVDDAPKQAVPVSSLLNPESPSSDESEGRKLHAGNIASFTKPIIDKESSKISVEEDICHAFVANVHGRVYQSKYSGEQREAYLDKNGLAKNRSVKQSHTAWKEQNFWPGLDLNNPVYYDRYGKLLTTTEEERAGSNQGSEAHSPAIKGSRAVQAEKNGKGAGKGGGRQNKGREAPGGRDRDSPDPPAKVILDNEERLTLTNIRQRQAELKRFYSTVAVQQKEALEVMVSRDLKKVLEKPKAHTKLPEYDEILQDLQAKKNNVHILIDEQYKYDVQLAEIHLKSQQAVLSSQFEKRVEESQKEHIQGAQGDLVLFRKAHLTAKDETRTNNGSEIEPYFPRYHELPEADVGPRGYTSTHIQDEKPFKENLASYDEQANQEVIDNDIVGPVAQSVAEENVRRKTDEDRNLRLQALVTVSRDELRRDGGYLIPRPLSSPENPQFALSRLADCAEYISRDAPKREYIFMPLGPADIETIPLDHLEKLSTAGRLDQNGMSIPASPSKSSSAMRSAAQRQKSLSLSVEEKVKEEPVYQQHTDAAMSLPLIAPAPMRPSTQAATRQQTQALPFAQMPPPPTANVPPSPSQMSSRRSSLGPLRLSRPLSATSPAQSIAQPLAAVPPPPSPTAFGGPLYPPFFPNMLAHHAPPPRSGHPFSQQPYHPAQPPPPPRFEQQQSKPASSALEYKPPPLEALNIQHRFPQLAIPFARPRVGGPKREPGQITFTPAQTPDSERFKNPPQAQPLPPGQAVYRPNSLQQLNSARGANPPPVVPAPPDPNVRSQQAADVARQTASINQGQGAGPKGGRRILLPKKY